MRLLCIQYVQVKYCKRERSKKKKTTSDRIKMWGQPAHEVMVQQDCHVQLPAAPGMSAHRCISFKGHQGVIIKKSKNKSKVTEEDEGLPARDFTRASILIVAGASTTFNPHALRSPWLACQLPLIFFCHETESLGQLACAMKIQQLVLCCYLSLDSSRPERTPQERQDQERGFLGTTEGILAS